MLFVSKIKDLRLIRRPADRIMDEQRNPIILKGERVEFSNFRYHTSDEDLIEWLCHHPLYGNTFTSDKFKDKPGATSRNMSDQDAIKAARTALGEHKAQVDASKQFDNMIKKKKKPGDQPLMIKGMMATAQSFEVPDPGETAPPTKPASITKTEVADMIKTEINAAMGQIIDLIKANAPTKKTFHCPICDEEFSSGMAVGKHKKEVHSAPEVSA